MQRARQASSQAAAQPEVAAGSAASPVTASLPAEATGRLPVVDPPLRRPSSHPSVSSGADRG
jgi:hypothetical protein